MAEVVTAQFVGWTSCGFVTGKYYEIEVNLTRRTRRTRSMCVSGAAWQTVRRTGKNR